MKIHKLIKNSEVITTWSSTIGDENYYEPWFGKRERWVKADQEDISKHIETRDIEGPNETLITEYKLEAEFKVETEDITAQIEAENIKRNKHNSDKISAKTFFKEAQVDIEAITNLSQVKTFLKKLTRQTYRSIRDLNDEDDKD